MLDWLIIGGGIHGTAISFYLTHRKRVSRDTLRVLDPHESPLALWKHFTANTGMQYLRSPKVHNLHYDPWSIRTFAETQQGHPLANFMPIYDRPSLQFFNQYSEWLIDRYALNALRIQGRANSLKRGDDRWLVKTTQGVIESKRIVLATGSSEQPLWTNWGRKLHKQGAPIHHIFDRDFVRADLNQWSHAIIVGGGISAAQTSLTLAHQHPNTVSMLSPHEIQIAHFDSDPCWVTRLCLDDFHAEPDVNKRREMITQARYVGTMPSNIADDLRHAIDSTQLEFTVAEVESVRYDGNMITLYTYDGRTYQSDCIILATGFESQRPAGAMLDELIATYQLPIADCGYPIVDKQLRWADDLYVMGALAELEIGPVARNIIGGRLASERIGQVI